MVFARKFSIILALFFIVFIVFFGRAYAGMIIQHPNYTGLTNGLVGFWSFDGKDMSGTTALDRSGQGNNGTLTNGPTPTEGKIGQGMSFDGSNDYVDVGNNSALEIDVPVTISGWIKVNAMPTGGNNNALIATDLQASNYSGMVVYLGEDRSIGVGYGDGGVPGPASRRNKDTSPIISIGSWHHIVGVIEGATEMLIYVDGVDIGGIYSGTGDAISYTASNAQIGAAGAWSSLYFNGLIDDVRIYNRALTFDEIKRLYNLGR
jgi:hypothetical protein